MNTSSNYDNKTARFTFTKSHTAGRYNMRNTQCKYLSFTDGTPEDIGKFFANILIKTLKDMEANEATKIILQCKWE